MMLDPWDHLIGRSNWISTQAEIVSKTTAGQMWIKKVKDRDSPRYNMYRELKLQWQDLAGQQLRDTTHVPQRSPSIPLPSVPSSNCAMIPQHPAPGTCPSSNAAS
jgi:hypothetical protein